MGERGSRLLSHAALGALLITGCTIGRPDNSPAPTPSAREPIVIPLQPSAEPPVPVIPPPSARLASQWQAALGSNLRDFDYFKEWADDKTRQDVSIQLAEYAPGTICRPGQEGAKLRWLPDTREWLPNGLANTPHHFPWLKWDERVACQYSVLLSQGEHTEEWALVNRRSHIYNDESQFGNATLFVASRIGPETYVTIARAGGQEPTLYPWVSR